MAAPPARRDDQECARYRLDAHAGRRSDDRRETAETPAATAIAEFRRRYPLGATSRVVLTDSNGTYAGIVATALAYGEGVDLNAAISTLAPATDLSLSVESNVGVVTEAFVRRRYAEELEKAQRDIFGER